VSPRLTAVPDDGADADVPGEPAPEGPAFAPDDAAFAPDDAAFAPDAALAPDDAPFAPDDAPVAPDASARGPHDAAWFEDLVRTHTRALHRYLVRRVGIDEADDLAADVLVVAWRRRDDVPDEVPLAWLYRTAGFVVANFRRKGRPIPVGDLPDEAADDDPAVHAVRDEQVREVLLRLSPRDRQIVLLNAWEGLAGDDLAAVLGIGRGGADAALSRARARLATAWSELA
jgi:RNA polymerase sigma-70 factor (ECF subfamily)